ncbi:MAG: hypothetical protein GAK28_00752 [Luteibacter sp.]|nr:MAG: hypothetical protein GAK28_00752 [Luteibacter sp.]
MRAVERPSVRQRGVALLIVLWGCTLAAITLGALATNARVESTQARGQSLRMQAFYAAQAGIEQAVFRLNASEDAQRWLADGRPYRLKIGDSDVEVSIRDEDGKINLNTASPEVIGRLLAASGVEASGIPGASAAIVGWGKRGHMDASMLLAKGGFASLEELYRVPGLRADIVDRISPALTLWSGENPNLAHASPLVVSAVTGADAVAAQAYVAKVHELQAGSSNLPPMPGTMPGSASVGASGVVNIVSVVKGDKGPGFTLDVTLILKSEPGDPRAYRVVRWREVSPSGDT